MEILTHNAEETKKLGQKVGSALKGGEVLALVGDLGSGKTTFIQGLASALGIENQIISPTFILMRTYAVPQFTVDRSLITNFYHLDLYRLEKNIDQELTNLGIKEYWRDPSNIVVIEWADKAKEFLPEDTKWIYFENIADDERKVIIQE